MSRQRLHLSSLKTSSVECGGYLINVPVFLVDAFKTIGQNITTVGIFRTAGQVKRVQLLKNSFFGEDKIPDDVPVNDVCDAVKAFFRELEEPLLTSALQDQFVRSAMTVTREDVKARTIFQLCRVLSQRHRETLAFLMWNLKKVSDASNVNKMDISNLALVLSMSVFRTIGPCMSSQVQDAKRDSALKASVIEILIKHAEALCRLAKSSEPMPSLRNRCVGSRRTAVARKPRTNTFVGVSDLRPPISAEVEKPRRRSGDWFDLVAKETLPCGNIGSKTSGSDNYAQLRKVVPARVRSTRRPWQRKLDSSVMNTSDSLEKTETPVKKVTRSASDAAERRQVDNEDGMRRRSVGMPAKIKRGQPNTIRTGLDRAKSKPSREGKENVPTESKIGPVLPGFADQAQAKEEGEAKPLLQTASAEGINEEEEEAKDDFVDVELRKQELLSSKEGPPASFTRLFLTPSTPSRDRTSIAFIRTRNRGHVLTKAAMFEKTIRQDSSAAAARPKLAEKPSIPTFTQVPSGSRRWSPTKNCQTGMILREQNYTVKF